MGRAAASQQAGATPRVASLPEAGSVGAEVAVQPPVLPRKPLSMRPPFFSGGTPDAARSVFDVAVPADKGALLAAVGQTYETMMTEFQAVPRVAVRGA